MEIAAQLGVDAIGLVFYPSSGRYITPQDAAKLLERKPPSLSAIAVFMDARYDDIMRIVKNVPFDCLQFHGSEHENFCASFAMPYWKSVPMGTVGNFAAYVDEYLATASGFVLDSNQVGQAGGTGKTFAWSKCRPNTQVPLIVSGGLTADNVADSIRCLHPYAVDVSSGVEAKKGIKNPQLMKQFVCVVRKIDEDSMHVG